MTQPNLRLLDRVSLVAALITPLLLMHAHGFAEASMGIASLCFLTRCGATGTWGWLRTPWMILSLVWCGWLAIASLHLPALGLEGGGPRFVGQALLSVRFPLFAAALAFGALSQPEGRAWMFKIVAASVIYICAQVVFQFIFGVNFYGMRPAWGVLLTGPFRDARAAPALARIMLPALIPAAARFLPRPMPSQLWAYALLLGGMAAIAIIGQRIPVLLAGGGLLVAALFMRRLRPAVLAAAVATAVLIPSFAIISPSIYDRMVPDTERMLASFATTRYGELYARALEIGWQRPSIGLGFDGFGVGCPQPRYFRPSFDGTAPDGGGTEICWVHPHNFYFEALADGGLPGLALFGALGITWLIALGRGLWRDPDPVRVGLFATILAQLVPFQSTGSFWSMPMGGWFYLLLGWGLAEAYARAKPA